MATSQNPLTAASASVPPVSDVPAARTAAGPPQTVPIVGGSIEQPSKALDDLAEAAPSAAGSIFDKVQGYVDRLSSQAKPYVDNASTKIDQFIDNAETRVNSVMNSKSTPAAFGTSTTGATGTTSVPIASSTPAVDSVPSQNTVPLSTVPTTSSTTTATGSVLPPLDKQVTLDANPIANSVSQRVEGIFAAVQSNFEKLTHTIDEKTASGSHAGIITQLTQVVEKGFEKVDQVLSDNHTTAHPPAVQTTTNSVPHGTEGSSASGAGTSVESAPVVGAAATSGTRADLAFAAPL